MQLTWNVDNNAQCATSEPPGYRIVWSKNLKGMFFYNAYFDSGEGFKHIGASFGRNECKDACQKHYDKNKQQP